MSSTERSSTIALVALGILIVANVVAAVLYEAWWMLGVAAACVAILATQWSAARRPSRD